MPQFHSAYPDFEHTLGARETEPILELLRQSVLPSFARDVENRNTEDRHDLDSFSKRTLSNQASSFYLPRLPGRQSSIWPGDLRGVE